MNAKRPGDDVVVAALCEALAPFPWRRFTPELLARFAVAARDRQELTAALGALQGAAVGTWERLEPVDRSDERATRVAALLTDLRRAETSLLATCRHLAGFLGLEPEVDA